LSTQPASDKEYSIALNKEVFSDYIPEGKSIQTLIQASGFEWNRRGSQLIFPVAKLLTLFNPITSAITDRVKTILSESKITKCDYILLVGGFAESDILHSAMQTAFALPVVVRPDRAGSAIMKGAVFYGLNQALISSRVFSWTVAIKVSLPYSEEHKKDGRAPNIQYPKPGKTEMCCDDVLSTIIKAGTDVKHGEVIEKYYCPADHHQSDVIILLYASLKPVVKYCDDAGCSKFATITVQLPKAGVPVQLRMKFGGTELHFEATELESGKSQHAVVNTSYWSVDE